MLVLSRKCQEKVYITCPDGSVIELTVVDIDRNFKVRLGLSAPSGYLIERDELRQARQAGEVRATLARDGR